MENGAEFGLSEQQQHYNVNKEFIQYTRIHNRKVDILQVYISIYKTDQTMEEKVNAIHTYAVAITKK